MTAAYLEQEPTIGTDIDHGLKWLRASVIGTTNGVNREAGIIHGVILAEEGRFKSEGRGEFDKAGI